MAIENFVVKLIRFIPAATGEFEISESVLFTERMINAMFMHLRGF
jgi:hypothetical protein